MTTRNPLPDGRQREQSVPERHGLERAFVRTRLLGVLGLALLAPLGGLGPPASVALVGALAIGNAVVWAANRRIGTLRGQRVLGMSAVLLDAGVVLTVVALAENDLAPSVNALLAIVVAEVAVRYTPVKGFVLSLALAGGLAGAMAAQAAKAGADGFSPRLFAFWAVLIVLLGMLVGAAVREVYRQRAVAENRGAPSPIDLPAEALAALTRREREVLTLIIRGYSNPQIAETLVIEPKTVKNHINRIYSKLALGSRYEAISRVLVARQDASTRSGEKGS